MTQKTTQESCTELYHCSACGVFQFPTAAAERAFLDLLGSGEARDMPSQLWLGGEPIALGEHQCAEGGAKQLNRFGLARFNDERAEFQSPGNPMVSDGDVAARIERGGRCLLTIRGFSPAGVAAAVRGFLASLDGEAGE